MEPYRAGWDTRCLTIALSIFRSASRYVAPQDALTKPHRIARGQHNGSRAARQSRSRDWAAVEGFLAADRFPCPEVAASTRDRSRPRKLFANESFHDAIRYEPRHGERCARVCRRVQYSLAYHLHFQKLTLYINQPITSIRHH